MDQPAPVLWEVMSNWGLIAYLNTFRRSGMNKKKFLSLKKCTFAPTF